MQVGMGPHPQVPDEPSNVGRKMKQCPKCKLLWDDKFSQCEDDGASLIALSEKQTDIGSDSSHTAGSRFRDDSTLEEATQTSVWSPRLDSSTDTIGTSPVSSKRPRFQRAFLWMTVSAGVLAAAGIVGWLFAPWKGARSASTDRPVPTSLAINAETTQLRVGETMTVRLIARYADGISREIGTPEGVKWSSSSPTILTVRANGEVAAKDVGQIQLTAQLGGLESAPVTIFVDAALTPTVRVFESIRIDSPQRSIPVGGTLALRPIGRQSKGQEVEIKSDIEWESRNPNVATVNAQGRVTGRKAGKALIVAKFNDIPSDPYALTVVAVETPRPPPFVPPPAPVVPDVRSYISSARAHRNNGQYAAALGDLYKGLTLDPKNQELRKEIDDTKQACDAEVKLGRTDLKC